MENIQAVKRFILFFSLSVILGCSKTEPSPAPVGSNNGGNSNNGGGSSGGNTFLDADGDGVDNETELSDATDPEDPCSFILESQQYSFAAEDWKNLDCDGDGVINKDEVDPDGNDQNEGNGTDPLDQCSLNYLLQTVSPSNEWKDLNCDEDCFLNGTEYLMDTNPTNPNLANIGSYLSKIYRFKNFEDYWLFENNGSQYVGYRTNAFGAVSSSYTYIDDKLEQVTYTESEQGTVYYVEFSYNGDQISSIDRYGISFVVEYENNLITATGTPPFTPPDLFATKIELESSTEKVIRCEKYVWDSGSNYEYFVYAYRYDTEVDNLIERNVERSRYDANTGEYEFVEAYTQSYEYYENILNPAREASEKLIIPALLVDKPDLFGENWKVGYTYFWDMEMTMASTNLIRSSTNTSPWSGIYLTDLCSETEGRPRIVYESPNLFGSIFNYSD